MMINNTMPKVFATTATINTEEPKSPGTAPTTNYMQLGCARTAISTTTIEKKD
jgi:hypothetical protein